MKQLILSGLVLGSLFASSFSAAQWQPDTSNKKQVQVAAAIEAVRAKVPRTQRYFEEAYAFAVLPSVTRVAVGFGGATGKGLVIEGERAIGLTRFWQFSSGLQAGARNFSMFLFFKDKEALERYQSSKLVLLGQAGVALANVSADGTPSYEEGVALVSMGKIGLMAEFSYSGAKFTYKPLADSQ